MSKILISDLNDEKSHLFRQVVDNEWNNIIFTEISGSESELSDCWLLVCNRFTINDLQLVTSIKTDTENESIPLVILADGEDQLQKTSIKPEMISAVLTVPYGKYQVLTLLKTLQKLNKLSREGIKSVEATGKKQLVSADKNFRLVLDSMMEGCQIIGFDWRYLYVNPAAEKQNRRPAGDLLGNRFMDVWPDIENNEIYQKIKNTLGSRVNDELIVFFEFPDGSTGHYELHFQPVTEGVLITSVDITEKKLIEKELVESDERWQFALEGADHGVWDWNIETNRVVFSTQWKKQLGYESHEIVNDFSEWKSRVHPDDLENALNDLKSHIEGETPYYQNEHRLKCKNGSWKWVLDRGKIVARDNFGNPLRMVGTHTDINERKLTEKRLTELSEMLMMANEAAEMGIWKHDVIKSMIYLNDWAQLHYGIKSEEISLPELLERIHPEDITRLKLEMQQIINPESNGKFRTEYRIIHPDQSVHWLEINTRIEFQTTENIRKPVYGYGTVIDITYRKQMEVELIESERILRESQKVAGIGTYTLDFKTGIWKSSEVLDYIFGIDEQFSHSIEGWNEIIHPDWRTEMMNYFTNEVAGQKKDFNRIYKIERISDKSARWVHGLGRLEFDKNGTLLRMIGTIQDITERKEAQDAFLHNQRILELFVEHAPAAIAMFDTQMRYILVSKRFRIDNNLDDIDLKGKYHYDVFPNISERWRKVHSECLNGVPQHLDEDYFILPDGNREWLKWEVIPWYESENVIGGLLLFTEAITEHKNMMEALTQSEIRFRMLADSAPVGIVIIDLNQKGEYINQYFTEMFGYTLEDVSDLENWRMHAYPDEEIRQKAQKDWNSAVSKIRKGERHPFLEYPVRCKDGSVKQIDFRLAIADNKFYVICNDLTDKYNAQKELRRLEWMLTKKTAGASSKNEIQVPAYGDLTELNKNGLILTSVGRDVLTEIVNDYLSLLETSTAIYERDGNYALGIFSSGWCRFLDEASRKLCDTDSNDSALNSGKWHCHEACWRDASLKAIETNVPVDIECKGGIRLYALPINANNEIIGALNFGYGNPPSDYNKLLQIADDYKVPVEQLVKLASEYETRPSYIIDLAKKRLKASANLIGEIVNRKVSEKQIRELNEGLESLVSEKTRELQERIEELERFYEATINREYRIKELTDEIELLKKSRGQNG